MIAKKCNYIAYLDTYVYAEQKMFTYEIFIVLDIIARQYISLGYVPISNNEIKIQDKKMLFLKLTIG